MRVCLCRCQLWRCDHEFCYSCHVSTTTANKHASASSGTKTVPSSRQRSPAKPSRSGYGTPSTACPTDGYSEKERVQVSLIQRFLAGGFSLSGEHHNLTQQSLPSCCAVDSYIVDTMKDLHQLQRRLHTVNDEDVKEYRVIDIALERRYGWRIY
ncbi:hypothetical protein VPH35_085138 [Triticum aestivum]|uniref:uncharacterized protein n=1 Tax=Triticum aestivum TaxID=4565 RepID=UPI000843839B|nr:uncharacterized protein LOC123104842 [Triticum aestivum]